MHIQKSGKNSLEHITTQNTQRVEIIGFCWFSEGVVYGFIVTNDPINKIDPFGLAPIDPFNPGPNPHTNPDLKPEIRPPEPKHKKPDNPRRCETFLKTCLAICRSPACPPHFFTKGACVSGCFSGYLACRLGRLGDDI